MSRSRSPNSSTRGDIEHRKFVGHESALLLSKNTLERDKLKQKYAEDKRKAEIHAAKLRESRVKKWEKKTAKSPFAVDLVAEGERITEENRIRLAEEEARKREALMQRENAKNEIILKALAEFSDLEALRREKRAIMEEEQRLKALLALEKAKTHGKADRLAAERAQRERQQAKYIHRRQEYQDSLDTVINNEQEALRKKHGLVGKPEREPFRLLSTLP